MLSDGLRPFVRTHVRGVANMGHPAWLSVLVSQWRLVVVGERAADAIQIVHFPAARHFVPG